MLRLARATLHTLSRSSRFISLRTIPASIVFLYQLASVLTTLSAVASSLSRFSTHFFAFPLSSDSPPSRPLSRPFAIPLQPSHVSFCFSDPLCHCLSSSSHECLSSTSLFTPCHLPPTIVLSPSIYHPFHALPLSLFLSLAISHQLTHTLRRRQAPVPCGWSCALGDAAR